MTQKLIDDKILQQLEDDPQLTLSGLIGPIVSDSNPKASPKEAEPYRYPYP